MTTFLKFLAKVGLLAIALITVPVAQAQQSQPCDTSVPYGHFSGIYLTGLPEQDARGIHVFVLGDPGINNGTQEFLCRTAGDITGGGVCTDFADREPNSVYVSGNWGSTGVTACPSPLGADGDSPIGMLVTSIGDTVDGEGRPSRGLKYMVAAVGFSNDFGGYGFDLVHPFDTSGNPLPRAAFEMPPVPKPSIIERDATTGTPTKLKLNWSDAETLDDCSNPQNPLPTCPVPPPGGKRSIPVSYNLYVIPPGPCSGSPGNRPSDWSVTPIPTTASEREILPSEVLLPGQCSYLAVDLVVAGQPGNALSTPLECSGNESEQSPQTPDGIFDCIDNCRDKTNPLQEDDDNDGAGNACDNCPDDANKVQPGACGCGVADTDSDGDGTADCNDGCPNDAAKVAPGVCGCGTPDTDSDGDGTPDCNDGCPADPVKIAPGICGCGVADIDTDGDGFADCVDTCPNDFNPNQSDTSPCSQGCDVQISFTSSLGRGSGTVTWQTRNETDLVGFNLIVCKGGLQGTPPVCVQRTQLNDTLQACEECTTGKDFTGYSFIVAKHKSGHNIFVEALHTNGTTSILCGPAVK